MSKTVKALIYLILFGLLMLVAASAFGQGPATGQPATHYYASPSPSNHVMDYGLIGVLAVGVLSLLAFTVKTDRTDRHRLVDAIQGLSKTNESLATELRQGFNHMQNQVNILHKDLKDLQEEVKRR